MWSYFLLCSVVQRVLGSIIHEHTDILSSQLSLLDGRLSPDLYFCLTSLDNLGCPVQLHYDAGPSPPIFNLWRRITALPSQKLT
jgi:hypothetical protein